MEKIHFSEAINANVNTIRTAIGTVTPSLNGLMPNYMSFRRIYVSTSSSKLWSSIKMKTGQAFFLNIGADAATSNLYYVCCQYLNREDSKFSAIQIKSIGITLPTNTLNVKMDSEYIYIQKAFGGGICTIIPIASASPIEITEAVTLPSEGVSDVVIQ